MTPTTTSHPGGGFFAWERESEWCGPVRTTLARIHAGWEAGQSDAAIGAELGLTRRAVERRRHRAGLHKESAPVVDRAEVTRLYREGNTAAEIADVVGCTHRTAQQLLYKLGLTRGRGR